MRSPDVLLDTNALLWVLDGDDRIGSRSRRLVAEARTVAVSVASLWEIAIKVSIGKLAPVPGLPDVLGAHHVRRLDISDAHLSGLLELPFHHRDPFDRLLISQAEVEGMAILTSDRAFAPYDVDVLDVRK
jgi:PIN domain nuclease of toxin-antitoxin system